MLYMVWRAGRGVGEMGGSDDAATAFQPRLRQCFGGRPAARGTAASTSTPACVSSAATAGVQIVGSLLRCGVNKTFAKNAAASNQARGKPGNGKKRRLQAVQESHTLARHEAGGCGVPVYLCLRKISQSISA